MEGPGILCIVIGGYLHILGAPSVQSCCTLWIFVYGRYHKSKLVCLLLSDLDWSQHHPRLWAAAPVIQRVCMAGMPKNSNSSWGRESSTQFAQQLLSVVTAPTLVDCVVWSSSAGLFLCIIIMRKVAWGNYLYWLNCFLDSLFYGVWLHCLGPVPNVQQWDGWVESCKIL